MPGVPVSGFVSALFARPEVPNTPFDVRGGLFGPTDSCGNGGSLGPVLLCR